MFTTESKNLKATLNGEVVTEIPEDLFIPPDALRVILEKFEVFVSKNQLFRGKNDFLITFLYLILFKSL